MTSPLDTSVFRRRVELREKSGPSLREPARALLADLALVLARATPQRKGKGRQAMLRDLVAAVRTPPVPASCEPGECVLQLAERFSLHFEQRDVDILLQIDI
jgi:hypothetical protein